MKTNSAIVFNFHGYGESTEIAHPRLKEALVNKTDFDLVSPQAMHSFYLPNKKVGYSWMTNDNRELHIQNNQSYFEGLFKTIFSNNEYREVVLVGYSQGVAMAWRVLRLLGNYLPIDTPINMISVGGGIPPELGLDSIKFKELKVNLLRGAKDPLYCEKGLKNDRLRLEANQIEFDSVSMKTGHRWVVETSRAILSVLELE